jgi:hypothetical protein
MPNFYLVSEDSDLAEGISEILLPTLDGLSSSQ